MRGRLLSFAPRARSATRPLCLSVLAALLLLAPPGDAAASRPARVAALHLRLERSEPAQGAQLAVAPRAIRLWFSLPPELAITRITLADAAGRAIPLGPPMRGKGATDPVEATVTQALAAGRYTVTWRTSSRDGHPIKGTFTFSVARGAG